MDNIGVLLFGLLISISLILLFREVYCWYSKINDRIKLMQRQIDQSRETNRLLTLLLQEAKKDNNKKVDSNNKAATLELSGIEQ